MGIIIALAMIDAWREFATHDWRGPRIHHFLDHHQIQYDKAENNKHDALEAFENHFYSFFARRLIYTRAPASASSAAALATTAPALAATTAALAAAGATTVLRVIGVHLVRMV